MTVPTARAACGRPAARGEGAVGRRLAVRDEREPLQDLAAERRGAAEVDGQLEPRALALEVLVQLAADRVDRLRRPQDPDAERLGEPFGLTLRLRVERDPAEAAVGRRDEQRSDRRVGEVVGDVEQAGGGRSLAEAPVQSGGDGHCILLLSRRTPAEVAWRAASSLEPSAAPMAA